MTRTRPSSRNTIPVTLTEWRGRSSIGARLLRCPLVGQPPLLAGEDVDDRLYRQVILGEGDADNLQHLLGLGEPQESLTWGFVAEREGFEPPGRLHARLLSRQLQSTRLCHRSQQVRRRRDDRQASVQALLVKYPEPSAARIYSAPRVPRGTKLRGFIPAGPPGPGAGRLTRRRSACCPRLAGRQFLPSGNSRLSSPPPCWRSARSTCGAPGGSGAAIRPGRGHGGGPACSSRAWRWW